jgi:hypothetical protein
MAIEATKSNIDSFVLTNSSVDADINKIDLINRYLDMNNDPYTIFMNAIKSPNTREKYDRRLKIFLDFIKIPGDDMKNRCIRLSEMGKNNNQRTISCIIAYIMYQKERLEKKGNNWRYGWCENYGYVQIIP